MFHLLNSTFSLLFLIAVSIAMVGYAMRYIRTSYAADPVISPISSNDMAPPMTTSSTSTKLSGLAGMPMDMMTHTLSFCTAHELGTVSCVHPYWRQAAQYKRLWYNLYRMQTGSDAPASSQSDWRSAYIHRSSLWSRLRRARHSWRRILHHNVIFLIIILVVLIYGLHLTYHQYSVLSRAISTHGSITSSELVPVASTDSEGHTTYSYVPMIIYEYSYLGQPFHGNNVYVMEPYDITDVVADSLVKIYPKNSKTTVYLDPLHPYHSFLLAEPILAPYIYIVLPLCALCLLMSLSVSQVAHVHTHATHTGAQHDIPPQRVPIDGEWVYEIMDTRQVDAKTRMMINAGTLICVHGIGTLSLFHFMYNTDNKAHEDSYWWARTAFFILQLFALLPTYITLTSLRLSLYVEEACVYAPTQTYFILGNNNPIIVTQKAARNVHIYGMDVRIECLERYEYQDTDRQTHTALRSVYAQTITVASAQQVSDGESIIGRGSFLLPTSAHPSFRGPRFPQYLWSLTILTHPHGLPTYQKHIAIHVIPAPTHVVNE